MYICAFVVVVIITKQMFLVGKSVNITFLDTFLVQRLVKDYHERFSKNMANFKILKRHNSYS